MQPYLAMGLAATLALLVTAVLGYAVIPWLHKLKFGQTILDIGPYWHKHKQGTPTMGGIMFVVGTVVAVAVTFGADALLGGGLLFGLKGGAAFSGKLLSGLLMALLFGLTGFLDDYTKVVRKRNKGLSVSQKSVLQILIIGGYLYSLWLSMGKEPYTLIPFVGQVQLGWFFWIFGFAVLYSTVNAVNFTDGVDGLLSSVTLTAGGALTAVAALLGFFGAGVVAAAMAGGCAGFLVWNRNPAKVIMGDTGSLFLGGLLVALVFALDLPVLLLAFGLIYVIEGISDVLQIGYFKLTHGKRIFKMAPIHHHFEMLGWKENKIVLVFSLVNILGCVCGIAAVVLGLKIFLV
jgi:phospho-N-acetylmuramoyl-pentapeptide-transferase